jgi:membrane protein YqaA with SNARE-associated domain
MSGSLLGLFSSAFISSTIAPGGSELVLAYLLNSNSHDPWLLVAIATIGNTLGAWTTWGLGFWLSHKAIDEAWLSKHEKNIGAVKKWGAPILLLSWLPIVGDGFCLAAGWLRISMLLSLALIAMGKLSRYAVIAYAFN